VVVWKIEITSNNDIFVKVTDGLQIGLKPVHPTLVSIWRAITTAVSIFLLVTVRISVDTIFNSCRSSPSSENSLTVLKESVFTAIRTPPPLRSLRSFLKMENPGCRSKSSDL
jgi:hypothetical protein